jgi:hypothetical protein
MKYLSILLLTLSGCAIELSHTDVHEYAYDMPECSAETLKATSNFTTYTYENGDAIYVSKCGNGYMCVKRK